MGLSGKSTWTPGSACGKGLECASARAAKGTPLAIADIDGQSAAKAAHAIFLEAVDVDHWGDEPALVARCNNKTLGQQKVCTGAMARFDRSGAKNELTGRVMSLAKEEARNSVAQTYSVDGGQWMS